MSITDAWTTLQWAPTTIFAAQAVEIDDADTVLVQVPLDAAAPQPGHGGLVGQVRIAHDGAIALRVRGDWVGAEWIAPHEESAEPVRLLHAAVRDLAAALRETEARFAEFEAEHGEQG